MGRVGAGHAHGGALVAVLALSALTTGCGLGPWQREVVTKTRTTQRGTDFAAQIKVLAERDLRSVQLRISRQNRCTLHSVTLQRDTVHEQRSFMPLFYVEVVLLGGAFATPWWYGDGQQKPSVDTMFLTALLLAPTLTMVLLDGSAPRERRVASSRVVDRSSEPDQLCGSQVLAGAALELQLSDGTTRRILTDQDGYVRVAVRPDLVLDVIYHGVVVQRVDIYAPETEPEEPASPAPSDGAPPAGAP